ncbi:MAG: HAD family hydrolase [Lachnospiraceae bacterium]|nr:HAD family hydrolase [Lachnospiraceae bacterium]
MILKNYKKYRAIFFDWDGTAVLSRKAPAEEAVRAMKPLLGQGTKLVIVSGTTMENIADGEIGRYFTAQELDHLYLGLGRGAFNYAFREGSPYVFRDMLPDRDCLEKIHRICFEIHMELKKRYDFDTDIVFSRPNYCKIDLMPEALRGDNLFMQENELEILKESFRRHGIADGLKGLTELAVSIGREYGMAVKPTCDAKYLEVGISSKSDNADTIFEKIEEDISLKAQECAFWGDEFVGAEEGIYGSDSFMITGKTRGGDFFDVSDVGGERPDGVVRLGGGVERFLDFLRDQGQKE